MRSTGAPLSNRFATSMYSSAGVATRHCWIRSQSGAVAHAALLAIDQQDRAQHAAGLPLDQAHDVGQQRGQRGARGDALEHHVLVEYECL